ncbi:YgiQ family radical SAM protein [bacterium]|nr:YgiQ family radical SAM protein [bacterium]
MMLPVTQEEMSAKGWDACDVILVTGDTYIDSPFVGVAVIGSWLARHGFRVGIIPQPDPESGEITRLGEPRLFWGVSGGSLDSLVANYTAGGKWRKSDDLTPGGLNNRRPNRASLVYTNIIRRHFKSTRPIVLGGVEASMRRVVHYDFWTDRVRKSILFNAKADYLAYGMAERTVLEIARHLQNDRPLTGIRGLCSIAKEPAEGFIQLPSYDECAASGEAFTEMFRLFYDNQDPLTAKGLSQRQDARWLIHTPPQPVLSMEEMDAVHDLDYTREVHPACLAKGAVRAQDTIRFSIPALRGCYGECNFCSIAVHQGRRVAWRSEESILKEARRFTGDPAFRGIISDVGGPTANMYGFECAVKTSTGACRHKRCLYPDICGEMHPDHSRQTALLRNLRSIPGIRHVFVASGLRHDLIVNDPQSGESYLREVTAHHTSGQLKIAPEHTDRGVLALMGKPGREVLQSFRDLFSRVTAGLKKRPFLTYYFIAAHPGCSEDEMRRLRFFAQRELHISPEQVQIYTPLPSTWSAVMYYTKKDPFTGKNIFVEKRKAAKERQKSILTGP